jgi:proteasome lid subunit RPN8/RPN11
MRLKMTSVSTSSDAAAAVAAPAEPGQPEVKRQWHGGPITDCPVKVVVFQEALAQVAAHSQSNLEAEVGGVLLGQVADKDGRYRVTIEAALPAVSQDHGPVHFTFTADAWSQLHRDKEKHYPDLQIVGWFHTHPDLGVFFSADDVVVHSAAFVMPWHVALVVDPLRDGCCFFAWGGQSGKEILPLPGFYEQLDRQPESMLPWQPVKPQSWASAGELLQQARRAMQPYTPHPGYQPMLPPISPWWGAVFGGLSLLISLFLLFERFWQ